MRQDHQSRSSWIWGALIAVWAACVVAGTVAVWRYKLTPVAPASEPPASWPAGTVISPITGTATLVMLAHPKCTCTRASLAELARLMATAHGRATAHVLFVKPAGTDDGWERTDTWRRAATIPDVSVHLDDDGAQARLFGATVSGYVVAYDAAGRLIFHGGITGARGHEGDNPGLARLQALVAGGDADRRDSPTFGCELEGPEEARR